MEKRTIISGIILFALICLLLGFSIIVPDLWIKYFSHWTIPLSIALIMTLLIGLVLMDNLFEIGNSLVITLKNPGIKIEINKSLVCAFLIVCIVSIIFEVVQFFVDPGNASCFDPLTAIAGSLLGIILHIMGSKCLMKRVAFELERWEDNVL